VVTSTLEQTVIGPLEDRLRERLEFLKKNRDEYVATAQRQLAALDAAIGELSALLNPATEPAGLNGASDAEST
jgi:tRNA U34 5-carboxymethylaminomethyl modifying GTPase MnmE/TrmE